MNPFPNPRSIHTLRNLWQDRRGISAVEFALLLPIMISLYLGGVELTEGLSVQRKVTLTANALVNLTAQSTALSDNSTPNTDDMNNIMAAASAVMYPHSADNMTAIVSCLKIDPDTKQATVKWSVPFPSTGSGHAVGSIIAVNSDLAGGNANLLLSEVTYPYTPPVGYTITGTMNISDKMYMAPRISPPTFDGTSCTS
ncbi:MAG TPA: TadE/TadG family type IV pilus assembly protein [Pseudolabrys sp.]|nr:TadE/TadG family type IV pilus assembly protein [Pseudolabrys sp.]